MPDLHAHFEIGEDAESMYPMVPDDGDDEMTAMAMVNREMMVEVNMPAILTAAFVEGAANVVLLPGENMPFAHLDWSAPQALVVSNGATFLVTPVQIGANQIPIPVGDPVPVTCGPFACAEDSMTGPEVTIEDSMACTMWEPTLELQVGLIDNSLSSHEGAAYVQDSNAATTGDQSIREVAVFDGLDLGWTYTSNLDFDVTHDLAVVNKTTKGVKKKSSATPMSVSSIGAITLGRPDAGGDATAAQQQTYYALSASPEDDAVPDPNTNNDALDVGSCQPVSTTGATAGANLWAYNDNIRSRISKPDNCFRITVDHGLERNYLDPYTVTMAPKGADVSWGEIAWEAWEELTCPDMTFSAMEQVDVCAMFEDEVSRLPDPTAVAVATTEAEVTAASNITEETLAGFNLNFKDAGANRHRFTAMWYARKKADGKDEMPPPNLYAAVEDDANTADVNEAHTANRVSGYNATVWVPTLDDDNDPIYGDLGKVTIDGLDKPDNFATTDDSYTCSADDGGSKATGTSSDPDAHANSTLCDAKDVEIETSVTFPLGLGYGCDPVKVEYTLTCQWSARGNIRNTIIHTPGHISADDTNPVSNFVSCKVS